MSDKSQTRLELLKLVWSHGTPGDKAEEAVAQAKTLERYVLEGQDDASPGPTTPKPAPAGRRR